MEGSGQSSTSASRGPVDCPGRRYGLQAQYTDTCYVSPMVVGRAEACGRATCSDQDGRPSAFRPKCHVADAWDGRRYRWSRVPGTCVPRIVGTELFGTAQADFGTQDDGRSGDAHYCRMAPLLRMVIRE